MTFLSYGFKKLPYQFLKLTFFIFNFIKDGWLFIIVHGLFHNRSPVTKKQKGEDRLNTCLCVI